MHVCTHARTQVLDILLDILCKILTEMPNLGPNAQFGEKGYWEKDISSLIIPKLKIAQILTTDFKINWLQTNRQTDN